MTKQSSWQRRLRASLGTLVMAVTVGGCVNTTEAPLGDDIVFALTSRRDGNDEVYLIDTAGATRNLTQSTAEDRAPIWSPDGEHLLFVSGSPGDRDVYIIEKIGGKPRNVTDHPGDDFDPTWSPDGNVIAFVSDRDGNEEIYLVDWRNGLTRNVSNHEGPDFDPAWSADGRIAFASGRSVRVGIFVLDLESNADPVALVGPNADNTAPVWSPDGEFIAFESNVDGASDVFVVDVGGNVMQNVSQHPAHDLQPTWSPDGAAIAILSNRDGNWEIYSISRDGSVSNNLTQNAASDARPVWSPDGTRIAFETERNGNWDVFVMAADGSGVRAVTTNAANDGMPSWRPR